MYQLVFKGQCTAGVDVAVARANVAKVFKANDTQLDRMFSGERVIIRNKLDDDAAAKYQAALAKQGIVVHIEAMSPPADQPAPAAVQAPGQADTARPQPHPEAPAKPAAGPSVEPGDRLPVAGERVDQLLAGSSLSLGRPGETLGHPREFEARTFANLDSWSLAPAGERLVEAEERPPVAVPDVSHLDVLPPGSQR